MALFSLSTTVDPMTARVVNEVAVVTEMTAHMLSRIRARTAAGQGADGRLPAAKDTGAVLERSGSFLASFGMRVRHKASGVEGVVRALGPRPRDERGTIRRRVAAAKERTSALRARAEAAVARTSSRGQRLAEGLSADERAEYRAGLSLSRNRITLSRLRSRTVVDQGSLAAILSVPPRDPNGRKGGRGTYRVFVPRPEELRETARIAAESMVVSLATGDR